MANNSKMKIKELRIGNWYVIAENDGIKYKQVEELIKCNTDYFTDIDNLTYAAKPIHLTEEWLTKFGFVRKEYIMLGEIHFDYCLRDLCIEPQNQWIYFKNVQIVRKFLYVHQLQNLYFALTGEEL